MSLANLQVFTPLYRASGDDTASDEILLLMDFASDDLLLLMTSSLQRHLKLQKHFIASDAVFFRCFRFLCSLLFFQDLLKLINFAYGPLSYYASRAGSPHVTITNGISLPLKFFISQSSIFKGKSSTFKCPSLALHPFELCEMDREHTFEVGTHEIHYEGLRVTAVKQLGRLLLLLS
ncbi:hypothetical protein MTR_2g041020 [Medicago truncatula]|uniref:Uncharacterized protein n=1 Tax=Medicago truncatula TaxID=3880 RepID=A0A072VHA1_MEDTR|nr:hypothetical protein MTR_2g041020 [Medicago truncatula]